MVEDIFQLPESGFTNAWAPNEDTLVFTARRGGLWFRNGLFSSAPFVARGGRKPVSAHLNAVTSVGQGRLFAVGDGGARVRRQNNTWSVDALGAATTASLHGIAARSPGELYAVGDQGTVLVRRWGTWVAEAQGLSTESLRAVVLDTEYGGQVDDPWGNKRVAFTATTRISRREFGLKWNQLMETGGAVVSDDVTVTLHIEAVRQA